MSIFAGTTTISVKGKKGGNITLPCEFEAKDVYYIDLSRLKNILSCQNEECESESENESQNGRVFKNRSCDMIFKNLKLSDAGKYILRVHYTNTQGDVMRQIRTYRLHFQGKVKTDQTINMGFLIFL